MPSMNVIIVSVIIMYNIINLKDNILIATVKNTRSTCDSYQPSQKTPPTP